MCCATLATKQQGGRDHDIHEAQDRWKERWSKIPWRIALPTVRRTDCTSDRPTRRQCDQPTLPLPSIAHSDGRASPMSMAGPNSLGTSIFMKAGLHVPSSSMLADTCRPDAAWTTGGPFSKQPGRCRGCMGDELCKGPA